MEPVSLANIVAFFEDEIKLIGRGENAYKSTRVEQFIFDGSTGIIRGKVRSSLKDIVYSVEVPIFVRSLEGSVYSRSAVLYCRTTFTIRVSEAGPVGIAVCIFTTSSNCFGCHQKSCIMTKSC